jgi:hypothetical protein
MFGACEVSNSVSSYARCRFVREALCRNIPATVGVVLGDELNIEGYMQDFVE